MHPIFLPELARLLGIAERQRRFHIDHVRQLVRTKNFPAPMAIRFRNGIPLGGADAVHAHSKWDRALVSAWLDDQATPAARAVHDQAAKLNARASLRSRAAQMFGLAA
jgi:hypothetical protein